MKKELVDFFENEKIEYYAPVPIKKLKVIRPHLLTSKVESARDGSALMICVPYFVGYGDNVSAYAVGRDYHLYFRELFSRLVELLRSLYPGYEFFGSADHSPIDEVHAAAVASLGVIGEHGLLITERYSSMVFIGEILSDMPVSEYGCKAAEYVVGRCEGCGICARHCPVSLRKNDCLSALTQKKGELCPQMKNSIAKSGCAWGCDVCQKACPHTKRAEESGRIYTDVDFFRSDAVKKLTSEYLLSMSDGEFSLRAYSWRGKKTILRNIGIIEGEEVE